MKLILYVYLTTYTQSQKRIIAFYESWIIWLARREPRDHANTGKLVGDAQHTRKLVGDWLFSFEAEYKCLYKDQRVLGNWLSGKSCVCVLMNKLL